MKRDLRKRKEEDAEYEHMAANPPPILESTSVNLKCKNERQKEFSLSIKRNEITICAGPAGTGKTFIACAEALRLFKSNLKYKSIIIVKSVTTLKDEEIGYLKGTMEEKMEPFVYSFIHNFEKLVPRSVVSKLRETRAIQVLPLAYIRGINIDDSIIIVDECQNISKKNMRTILTRLGSNSKMILLGDLKQIDMKNNKDSGLPHIMEVLADLDGVGVIQFERDDIVRNPLVQRMEERFDEHNIGS